MSLLESLALPLNTPMPDFNLSDPSGTLHSSDSLYGNKGLLIAFTCNHCPYAIAVWPRLLNLANHAKALKINTVAINPNIHPNYPEDAPEAMKKKITEWNINFPYLIDEKQDIAKSFQARCTPDIYLFDHNHNLVYHGRIDDNWKDESKVKHHELKMAIEGLANGDAAIEKQMPSMGCSIKWK